MASEAFWDSEAKGLDETLLSVWAVPPGQYESTTLAVLDLLHPWIPPHPARILDLGCGPGRMSLPLAERFPEAEIIGCDISEKMLALARNHGPDINNVLWLKSDGRTIQLADSSVTFAFEVVMFQHNEPHICAALTREVSRVLAPGGVFAFQTIENIEYDDWGHLAPEVPAAWATDAGLEVIGTQRGIIYGDWLWTIARKPEP